MTGPLRFWRRTRSERLHDCRVFGLRRARFETDDGERAGEYFVVDAPDWINVIPLTDAGQVVLIRQYRFGVEGFTLEIPGGMCDPGEDPQATARRELNEETGYDSDEIVSLGWVHPNPAIQGNRCHSFLARGARRTGPPTPDGDESFEVSTVPLAEIEALIRDGSITHSLVIAAFYLLGER